MELRAEVAMLAAEVMVGVADGSAVEERMEAAADAASVKDESVIVGLAMAKRAVREKGNRGQDKESNIMGKKAMPYASRDLYKEEEQTRLMPDEGGKKQATAGLII